MEYLEPVSAFLSIGPEKWRNIWILFQPFVLQALLVSDNLDPVLTFALSGPKNDETFGSYFRPSAVENALKHLKIREGGAIHLLPEAISQRIKPYEVCR